MAVFSGKNSKLKEILKKNAQGNGDELFGNTGALDPDQARAETDHGFDLGFSVDLDDPYTEPMSGTSRTRTIDPAFVDWRRMDRKYMDILNRLQWKDAAPETALISIPDRYYVMLKEAAMKCRFSADYDEDNKTYYIEVSAPEVFCSGQTAVTTRNELRKKRSESEGLVWHRGVDPHDPVIEEVVGVVCPDKNNPEGTRSCAYNICPLKVTMFIAYHLAYGETETLERYREQYRAKKDEYDLDEDSPWYSLTLGADFVFRPYGRGYYVPEDKLLKAKAFLDEGLYSSTIVKGNKDKPTILALYDSTYTHMGVTDFGKRNDVEPFEELSVEHRPAESLSRHQSVDEKMLAEQMLASEHDFRQFSPCPYCDNEFCEIKYAAFADMLIQAGNFEEYLRKSREHKQKHDARYASFTAEIPRLEEIRDIVKVQNNFYGCVAGNSERLAMDVARLVAEEISYRPCVSPNVARMTMLELLNELNSNVYYKKITDYNTESWGKPANNQIYVLSGINEFLKFIARPETKEANLHLINHLAQVKDNRYFILVGSRYEIDSLFNEFAGIAKVFTLGKIEIEDMTANEIYDAFTEKLSDDIRAKLTEDFKTEAIDYIALNQGVIPYNNEEMAIYLANYVNQMGLRLPELHQIDVEKMLSEIVGMDDIKNKLKEFEAYTRYQKMVKAQGIKVPAANTHMVFLGNPGTGKTTIARIVAQMMFNIGLLRKNSVVEVQRKDLIGEYVGHTAIKTQGVIDKAMGGVLFIDEAYSLTATGAQNDFGGECVATLIKAMEDHKDDLIVIFAGYVEEMGQFLSSNPGLESRVGYTFYFKDYDVEELADIFRMKTQSRGFTLDEGVSEKVSELCRYFKNRKDFGNGRFVDNIIQKTLVKHAQNANENNLLIISADDIPEIEEVIKTTNRGWEMLDPKDITEDELKSIAVHELGHAIARYYLAGSMDLVKISVQSDASGVLGFVESENKRKAIMTEKDLLSELAVLLSGKNAEAHIYGTHSSGCSNDVQRARDLADRMVKQYAMGDWLNENADKALLREADALSKKVIGEYEDKLQNLADKLVAKGVITKDEIEDFLN